MENVCPFIAPEMLLWKIIFFLFCFIPFITDVCCYNNLKYRHLAYLSKGWSFSECVFCWVRDLCNTMFLGIISFFSDCENVILSIKVNQNSLLWKLHALLHTGVLCKGLLSDSCRICGNYRLRFTPFSNSRFSTTAVLLIYKVLGSLVRITTILAEVLPLVSFVYWLYYSDSKELLLSGMWNFVIICRDQKFWGRISGTVWQEVIRLIVTFATGSWTITHKMERDWLMWERKNLEESIQENIRKW